MIATNVLALALMAALNPLVARAPEPRGLTPENCEVSGAPPMPRTVIASADLPDEDSAMPLPPVRPAARALPASTTSTHVAELKRALAANDRPAFDAALARAKEDGVATRVYQDIARIWDEQFESPFFAEDSDAYRVASSYPGYAEAVRRQVFTDASGKKYYPAAESRAFVATHAGVRSPTSRRITTTTADRTPARTPSTTITSQATTSRTTTSRTTARRSRPVTSGKTASSSPAASRKKAPPSSPDPSAPPRIAAREPAALVPSPAADSSPAGAPPAAGMSETVAPSEPAPLATDTDAGSTDMTATTPLSETTAPPAATTTTTAAPEPAKGRPILIPAILILIGLGVLILLFRTKA